MWPYLLLIPAVYLAAVFDTSLGSIFDALSLVALVWALTMAGPRGYLATGAMGFVSDLVSPGRLGAGLACFAIVGYVLPRLRARLGPGRSSAPVFWAWPAATIMVLGPAVVGRSLGEVEVDWATLVLRALAVGASTAAAAAPAWLLVGWIAETRRRRQWA